MALNDIYRASALFSAPEAAGEMVVTWHYQTTDVVTAITPVQEGQEIADEVRDTLNSLYMPHVADSVTLDQVNVIGITTPTVGVSAVSGVVGTLPEGNVSYRCTVICRNITGLRGRSFSGHQEYIAPTEQQQSNGTLSAQFLTDMTTLANGMKRMSLGASGNKYDQVVYSRKLLVATLVTGFVIRTKTGSNRRRQDTTA